jgi:hypothetical protein
VRLSGRWLTDDPPSGPDAPEALLVIQLQGRRHRFPADRTPAGAAMLPGTWHAEFTVPSWAVPSRLGQAAVWVGTWVIAVGPPGTAPEPEPEGDGEGEGQGAAVELPAALAQSGVARVASLEGGGSAEPALDAGRGGPLAHVPLKETVSALRAELERRSAEAAQLRDALAGAQSELDARTARQASLESAQGELRRELEQLTAAATRQRRDFEARVAVAHDELNRAREDAAMATAARDETEAELARVREQAAGAHISRDASISEAGGLRAELERLGAELTVMREQVGAHGGDLGEAQRLLADARALTEELRGDSGAA